MYNIQQFTTHFTYSDDITVQVCQSQYQLPTLIFSAFNNQSVNQRYTHRHSLQFYIDLYLITACIQRNDAQLIKNAHTHNTEIYELGSENFRVLFLAASMFINKVT